MMLRNSGIDVQTEDVCLLLIIFSVTHLNIPDVYETIFQEHSILSSKILCLFIDFNLILVSGQPLFSPIKIVL